jgi:hypothetical protein
MQLDKTLDVVSGEQRMQRNGGPVSIDGSMPNEPYVGSSNGPCSM